MKPPKTLTPRSKRAVARAKRDGANAQGARAQLSLITKAGTARKRREAAPPKRGVRRGRPPKAGSGVPHVRREKIARGEPVHVTWRLRRGLPNLRSPEAMGAFRSAFVAGKRRDGFRLVHFSVQHNHVHMLCEADDSRSLARGLQGLAIRVARSLNRALGRTGRVFADRYHGRAIGSPRETRHALVYVLNNARKHHAERLVSRRYAKELLDEHWVDDVFSSARHFDGWDCPKAAAAYRVPGEASEVAAPEGWLLRVGWLPRGKIKPSETPGKVLARLRASTSRAADTTGSNPQ